MSTGTVRGLYCTEYDIHDLKLTEQALAAREEQLRLFNDNIPEPVVYLDARTAATQFVNEAFLRLVRPRPRRGASARPPPKCSGPELAGMLEPDRDRAFAGEAITYERAVIDAERPRALDPRAHACPTSTSTARSRASTSSATTSPT